MQLSKNFSFEEMTNSDGHPELVPANRKEAQKYMDNLTLLTTKVLEPLREHFGAVKINSGFRGATLNKAVGSKSTASQHMYGEAADISIKGHSPVDVFKAIKAGKVPNLDLSLLSQVILEKRSPKAEFTWVHIAIWTPRFKASRVASGKDASAKQMLVFDGVKYFPSDTYFA